VLWGSDPLCSLAAVLWVAWVPQAWPHVHCSAICHSLKGLLPDQLVLLLEHLLEQKTLNPRTLQRLERTYHLPQQDAEVRHRWCELIVKHKYTKAYKNVERFLQEDQAMGIYLYGELMLSEDSRQQRLARRCFELTKGQMDACSAQVVAEMLF
uniref:Aminopeptidase O (putative) n=1 Tax=Rhinolophus ferrumequinum TaxID=59479 RepID=A0A671FGX5_RHIFE